VGLTPPQYKTQRVAAKKGGAPQLVAFATTMSRMPTLFAEFIFNEVFQRFPKLTVVGGEVGAGWVPFLLQELDDRFRRNRVWCDSKLEMLPSEYYQRNCKVGLVNDQFGVQNCDAVGVETMMWCSDFPHHITDWPHSRHLINSMAQGVDESKRRKIFCETAGKLYGFIE
jgi:predicted TIM-barrel fold metal-dependent hydrolase